MILKIHPKEQSVITKDSAKESGDDQVESSAFRSSVNGLVMMNIGLISCRISRV